MRTLTEYFVFWPDVIKPSNVIIRSQNCTEHNVKHLHAFLLHLFPERTENIVLYFHGNSGNMTTGHLDNCISAGEMLDSNVMLFDYSGFGKKQRWKTYRKKGQRRWNYYVQIFDGIGIYI